jgi:membrane-associated phospholipid phosphatase
VARVIGPNEGNIRRGGVLLDEKVRDALRVKSRRGQFRARDASDFFLAVTVAYPFLIDSLALAYFRHDSEEVAVQMALINAEATVVSTALQTIANAVASRERPYGRLCGNDLDAGINDCIGRNRFRSFFSGHTSQSFMSAALTCSHHMNLPLLGGGPVEHTPCVVGFAFAAAAGLGRIMGDVHYWSDVMTGAISGAAVGFLVPWLHYRSELDLGGDPRSNVQWQVVPNGLGASVVGSF